METLPNIIGATAEVKDTKELLQQVSLDLTEERSCWSISLTCSDLGGENYKENHELYKRLFRAKQGDRTVRVTIEFQPEMDLNQGQMFSPEQGEAEFSEPTTIDTSQPDAADADWSQIVEATTTGDDPAPDADGVVRRTYMINGEEHEYGEPGTDADDPDLGDENRPTSEAPESPTGRRRRGKAAAEASE